MDKATFIKEIKNIFLDINAKEKKYQRVWLSEANFGGLYRSGRYSVNIKPVRNLNETNDELKSLVYKLHDKLNDEKRKYLYTIKIYDVNEDVYNEQGDIMLLNEESLA